MAGPHDFKRRRKARFIAIAALATLLSPALLFFFYNTDQSGLGHKEPSAYGLFNSGAKSFPMAKLAVVMALDGKEGIYGERSVGNKEDYCRHWGCKLVVDGIQDTTRMQVWSKLLTLREAMDSHRDIEWFWWLDADSVIMDPYVAVSKGAIDSIPAGEDKHFIIAKDCGGFNAGSFMIRNSFWSRLFLSLLYLPDFSNKFGYAEQGTIQYFFEETPYIQRYLHFVPQRIINAFPIDACGDDDKHAYRPGDLLIHFAGCRMSWRNNCRALFEDHMNKRLQLSEQEKPFSTEQVRFESELYKRQKVQLAFNSSTVKVKTAVVGKTTTVVVAKTTTVLV